MQKGVLMTDIMSLMCLVLSEGYRCDGCFEVLRKDETTLPAVGRAERPQPITLPLSSSYPKTG